MMCFSLWKGNCPTPRASELNRVGQSEANFDKWLMMGFFPLQENACHLCKVPQPAQWKITICTANFAAKEYGVGHVEWKYTLL